jgi:hypothetical protein
MSGLGPYTNNLQVDSQITLQLFLEILQLNQAFISSLI